MAQEIHILMLEDMPSDAQLSEYTLREMGLAFKSRLVDTAESYIEALDEFVPDLILADYSLPGFDGLSALKIAQARCPDVPFILLSGTLGEETAVESLKSGASDFVLKDRLERLGPAVNRALAQAKAYQQRKQAETALSEEHNLMRTLIDNLPDYIFIKDLQDRFVLSNIAHARAVQRTPDELIGKTAGELFSPELAAQYQEDDQVILQTGQSLINIERTTTDAAGEQRAVLSTKVPLRDQVGNVVGLVGISRDITERKRAEEMLRKSETSFRHLFANNPHPMYVVDLETLAFLDVNDAVVTQYGYSREEFLQMRLTDIRPEEDIPRVLAAVPRPHSGQQMYGEWRHRLKDGSVIDVEITTHTLEFAGREAMLAVAQNMTERKRAQTALAEERTLLRTLIDQLPDAVVVKDVQSRVLLDNVRHRLNFGLPANSVATLGKTDLDFHPRELAEEFYAEEQHILQSGEPLRDHEEPNVDPQGNLGWHLTTKVPLRDQSGQIIGIVSISRDITERKRIEAALAEERNLLRILLDTLPDAIYVKDTQGRFVLDNLSKRRNLGLVASPLETIGKTDFDFHSRELAEQFHAEEQRIILTGQPLVDHEEPDIDPQGNLGWHLTTKVPLRDQTGQIIGIVGVSRDITERKRSEAALAEERNLLLTLIDSLPDAVYIKDRQSRIIIDNVRNRQNLGVATQEGSIGKTDFDFHPRELAQQFYDYEQRLMESGEPLIDKEEPNLDAQGNLGWHQSTKVPRRDRSGQIIGFVGVSRDITDRKRAEAALAEERNLLRTLIDNLPDRIYVKDRDSRYVIVNKAIALQYNIDTPSQIVGKTSLDFSPPEIATKYLLDDQLVMSTGQPLVGREELGTDSQGNQRWLLTSKVPLRDSQGSVIGLVGMSRDITERKAAEEELRQSEIAEREQRVLAEALRDSATALTGSLEPEVVLRQIVENLQRVVPHQAANIMLIEGEYVRSAYWHGYTSLPDDYFTTYRLPLTTANLQTMLATRAPLLIPDTRSFAGWKITPDIAWIRSYAGVPIEAHGQVIGFLNVDSAEPNAFTQRHAETLKAFADQAAIAIENAQLYDQLRRYASQLEEHVLRRTAELKQVKERVEAILNNNSDGIVVTQLDSTIQQTNPAFDRLFGYRAGEAVGHELAEVVDRASVPLLAEAVTAVLHDYQSVRLELTAQRQDHTPFYAELALSPITGTSDELLGIVCNVRDITERKRMEAELRDALTQEKELNDLKSRFVSMASHEFRTPLTTILGSVGLLELGLDKMTVQNRQKHFAKIQVAIRHITSLLEDVLTIARADAGYMEFNPERFDLDQLCQDVIEEFQVSIAKLHVLDYSSQGDCKEAWLDERMLRIILSNLLSNAIKYSAQGSPVKLTLTCEAGQSIIQVQDTGIGIPEHDHKRMFEAFHRGNNVGTISGTGLGLAVTKKAVDLHGGTIQFETQVGTGTTFIVTLPTERSQTHDNDTGN